MKITMTFVNQDKDVRDMTKLGQEIWPSDVAAAYEDFRAFCDRQPNLWMLARNEQEEAVGYVGVTPVTEEAAEHLLAGTFVEKGDFTLDTIVPLEQCRGKVVDCYVPSVNAKNADRFVAMHLIRALPKFFELYKEMDIKVRYFIGEAYSEHGERLLKKLGGKLIATQSAISNGFEPRVYVVDFTQKNDSLIIQRMQEIMYGKVF